MAGEHVQTVERAIAAINARDMAGYLACCTEDVELFIPMVGSQYKGATGIRQFFTDIEDAGPDFLIEVERVEEVGESEVLAFLRVASTGRASGIPSTAETANVYHFVGSEMSHIRIFFDRGEALEAVGLEE